MSAATFEIDDASFAKILGPYPNLQLVADGFSYLEGPVYMNGSAGLGYLFFTDWEKNGVQVIIHMEPYAFTLPLVFRSPAAMPAGQTATHDGMLLTCGSTDHQVSVTREDGSTVSLVNEYDGKPLNSPNDICVKSDGTIWFTDPAYTAKEIRDFPAPELPNAVYRFDPKDGSLTEIVRHDERFLGWEEFFTSGDSSKYHGEELGLLAPNGVCFSPDEKTLYIADTGAEEAMGTYFTILPHQVWACDMAEDGRSVASEPRRFFETPGERPDGIRCDVDGNLYMAVTAGVRVVNPEGKQIGLIRTPANTGNLTFGGPNNDILFTTSSDSIWALRLNTQGAVPLQTMGFDLTSHLPEFFHNSLM